MAAKGLVRASALASVAFGALIALSAIVNLVNHDPTTAAWVGLVAAIFGLLGLVGIYVPRAERLGTWGLVAVVAATVGLALSIGQFYGLTFNAPKTGPLGPLFPLGYGPLLYGFVPLGLVILATRVLPRIPAAFLILGTALNAAGFAAVEVRLAGVILFGAGIAWLGGVVWASATAAEDDALEAADLAPAGGGQSSMTTPESLS